MFRWISLVMVAVSLTAAVATLAFFAPEPAPKPVTVDPVRTGPPPHVEIVGSLQHDFGIMSTLAKGKHSWTVKNSGEGNLELSLLGSSCSCTVAKLKSVDGQPAPNVVVKPGESTTIDLEWDTKSAAGPYLKSARIGTNDLKRPNFQLDVKGSVYPPVFVAPPEMIRFESISNEEVNRASVSVFSMDRPATKIIKLTSSRPELIVARQAPLTDDLRKQFNVKAGGYKLFVEIKPGMPIGSFQDEVEIETDHPLMPRVKVSVAGSVTGPISVTPPGLRIDRVTRKNGATGELAVLVRGDRPTRFEVAQKPAGVEVSIEPSETSAEKGRYRLRVTVLPGAHPGMIDDTMIIKTDHPGAARAQGSDPHRGVDRRRGLSV